MNKVKPPLCSRFIESRIASGPSENRSRRHGARENGILSNLRPRSMKTATVLR
jgi:hypothetical protein